MEDYVLTVKRVLRHMQWPTCACMGHSMGGQIGKLFAAVYPEHVERFVMLDSAGPLATEPEEVAWGARRALDQLMWLEDHVLTTDDGTREYTRTEALDRIKRRIFGELTDECAETLMVRYLRPGPPSTGKHLLANDPRLRVTYSQWFSAGQLQEVVRNMRCPTLLIVSTDSDVYFNTVYVLFVHLYTSNPNIQIVRVDGNHDVHQNHPRRVAPLINRFLHSDHPFCDSKL
jgi:pimeloyl-ACP methyl ester carboxylesterase